MKTRLISPYELTHSAVVPQCLDVHYVSDEVMRFMLHGGRDYHDPEVTVLRQREMFLEYRRSLLFARQTVINRAYFANPLIYSDFEEGFSNEPSRQAFRVLLETKAIVPYLFKSSDFFEDIGTLKKLSRAGTAILSLKSLVAELVCVRFAVDDANNNAACERLDQSFRSFVASLAELRRSSYLLNALAGEVFRNQELTHDELSAFGHALAAVSSFAINSDTLDRTVLYEEFLTEGDHGNGRFRKPADNPFMLAQKKVLDLRYNTALPDMLQRFALTPKGLPTHAAVDYVVPVGKQQVDRGDEFLSWVTDRTLVNVMTSAQEWYSLPQLSELTLPDIVKARSLPEWKVFADAQDKLLGHGGDPTGHLEEMSQKLGAFQRAFSIWYYTSHPEAKALKRYKVGITIVFNMLGVTLAVLASDAAMVERVVVGSIPSLLTIPERIKGFVARQVVTFVDFDQRVVDRSYSYSIDLLRSGVELSKSDVLGFFAQFGVFPSEEANAGAGNQN